jgi:hypothetical protein
MLRKFKNIIWKILIKLKIGGAIQLMLIGGLLDDGWYNSFNTKQSVDKNNGPIPWCTYPFIKFIEPRLNKEFLVFEFGSGNSTLWYSKRIKKIVSVENNKNWYDLISLRIPSNVKLIFQELKYKGDYSKSAMNAKEKFNIIIIDGRDRVNCVKNSLDALTENGVIIFDNSDLPQYQDGINFLLSNNFKKLDFIGLSPVTPHSNYTSIFYRSNNCLGI